MSTQEISELLEEAKCFGCLGASVPEMLKLALLARIQGTSAPPDDVVDNISLLPAQPYNQAHGFGGIPSRVKGVVKFIAAAYGYSVGDEVEFQYIYQSVSIDAGVPLTIGSNATNVWISSSGDVASGTAAIQPKGGGGGGPFNIDTTTVVGKLYIWR